MHIVVIGCIFFLFICFIVYARYIEPYQLEVKEVKVDECLGIKILHITDIHFGVNYNLEQLEKLVKKINSIEKDVIVFTGDFFDDRYGQGIDDIVSVLKLLDDKSLKYAIWGNHDYKHHAKDVYASLMSQSGFKLLSNEDEIIEINNQVFRIVGSDDYLLGDFNKEYLQSIDNSTYNILLLHEPDAVDCFKYQAYHLILSGHSHGGQVRLLCGIKGKTRMGRKYQEGLFILNHKTRLYVSGGLGTTGTRLRYRMKPSISVISL